MVFMKKKRPSVSIELYDQGINVHMLFKQQTISYSDIASIIVDVGGRTVVKTKTGEEYIESERNRLIYDYPAIVDKIVSFGIPFENKWLMDDSEESIIVESQKQEYIISLLENLKEATHKIINNKLGKGYELALETIDIYKETYLCFKLLRDGIAVAGTELPNYETKDEEIEIPIWFEAQSLLIPCAWDPVSSSMNYIKTLAVFDGDKGDGASLVDMVSDFCDRYLKATITENMD